MYKLAVAFDLFEPLRDRLAAGMPVYGSCAGMIMLADRLVDGIEGQLTLGGLDMTVRRNAFGRQVDSFEADVAARRESMARRFTPCSSARRGSRACGAVGRGRSGRVPRTKLRRRDAGAGRIVAVRQGVLLATAFHPELTGDHRVHALFVEIVCEYLKERP